MNKTTRQEEYKVFQGNNQLVLILNSEILLPENDPVRVRQFQQQAEERIPPELCQTCSGGVFLLGKYTEP